MADGEDEGVPACVISDKSPKSMLSFEEVTQDHDLHGSVDTADVVCHTTANENRSEASDEAMGVTACGWTRDLQRQPSCTIIDVGQYSGRYWSVNWT